MGYVTKEWEDRSVEHAGRRTLTNVSTGVSTTYDVVRDEGEVVKTGDAFSAENMNGMETRISNAFSEIALATVTVPVSGWSSSAPYTNTVSVSGMTSSWIPGSPVLVASGTSSTDIAAQEALACVSTIASASGKLTFTCYEEVPTVSFAVRIPGMMEA